MSRKKVITELKDATLAPTRPTKFDGGRMVDEEKNITRFDYSQPYKPGEGALKFFSFVNLVFGEQPNKTPKTHFMFMDHIMTRHTLQQVLAHRGLGKSEIVSNFLPLYIAYEGGFPGFGRVESLVLFSDTISQAQEHLLNMRLNYENSDRLQSMLDMVETRTVKPKVDQIAFDNAEGKRIFIQAKGAGESMRGTKKGQVRPQFLIFDDILNDNILTSEVERKKLHSWFFSTVSNAVDITHFRYVMINTPMTEDDIVGRARVSPSWHTLELPVAMDMNVPRDEMVVSWPDRFTPERVMQKYKEAKSMGAEGEFYREMMLEITNKELQLFDIKKIREFDTEDIKENFPNMLFFTAIDLAVSRKQSADFTAIITIGVDDDQNWFIVRADHGRWDMHETMDVLFERHLKKYNPLRIGAERASHQLVFNDFLTQRMLREQVIKEVYPLASNSQLSKEVRIATLVPNVEMGKIWIEKRDTSSKRELLHELSMMTREACLAPHDDLADCLASFNEPGFVVYPGGWKGTETGEGSFAFEDEKYHDPYMV